MTIGIMDWSDDDEELIQFIVHERRPYVVRQREHNSENYDDHDFFMRFRLRKETVLHILEMIEEAIETVTDRNNAISPIDQLLLTLRFYATGSFLLTVADTIKVSKTSASNIIKKVSFAIAVLAHQFVKMPTEEADLTDIKTRFFGKAALPRIIGSLDCTHVKIQSPGGPNAELFRNRKGYFFINVQTIACTKLKILDIVARWPDSAHDQTIFDNSSIKQRFVNNEFGNSLLVADSGYANTLHVITPLLQAPTAIEQLYNEAVTRTRNPVERQYGVWNRRFPILALGLRLILETSLAVIVATAVLHNIAIEQNEEQPPQDPEIDIENIDFDEDINIEPQDNHQYENARDFLLGEYFRNLVNNE